MTSPDFSRASDHVKPFPHFRVPEVLSQRTADALLDWFDGSAPWRLHLADFYEQHEFSLLHCQIPSDLAHIVSKSFVEKVGEQLSERLSASNLELVDVVAHRLEAGQTIRIHNDHVGDEETHRLIIQLNRGWSVDQGGLFLIFESDDPESVCDVMLPDNRSAFGFEISERSHHAVSTIRHGSRDSIVYTFRKSS